MLLSGTEALPEPGKDEEEDFGYRHAELRYQETSEWSCKLSHWYAAVELNRNTQDGDKNLRAGIYKKENPHIGFWRTLKIAPSKGQRAVPGQVILNNPLSPKPELKGSGVKTWWKGISRIRKIFIKWIETNHKCNQWDSLSKTWTGEHYKTKAVTNKKRNKSVVVRQVETQGIKWVRSM